MAKINSESKEVLTPYTIVVGNTYNWQHDKSNVLIYMGKNYSGNGYWHQFAQVKKPDIIWCEVLDMDIPMFEIAE